MLLRMVGALLFTYFASQAASKIRLPMGRIQALVAQHAIALGSVCLLVFVVRQSADSFGVGQLSIFVPAQAAWLVLDLVRGAGEGQGTARG